jgi:hypothetical protein
MFSYGRRWWEFHNWVENFSNCRGITEDDNTLLREVNRLMKGKSVLHRADAHACDSRRADVNRRKRKKKVVWEPQEDVKRRV